MYSIIKKKKTLSIYYFKNCALHTLNSKDYCLQVLHSMAQVRKYGQLLAHKGSRFENRILNNFHYFLSPKLIDIIGKCQSRELIHTNFQDMFPMYNEKNTLKGRNTNESITTYHRIRLSVLGRKNKVIKLRPKQNKTKTQTHGLQVKGMRSRQIM